MQVLLWVEPVSPASDIPGFYIQRVAIGANAVTRQPHPGAASTWEGVIQIGNAQYPPYRGDTLNIVVTLDDATAASDLLSGSQQTYTNPAGLSQTLGFAEAKNVKVGGVPSRH